VIQVIHEAIDVAAVLAASAARPPGRSCCFWAPSARRPTGGKPVVCVTRATRHGPADARRLGLEARRRWDLARCAIVHRLGELGVGETSVAIAVSAAHRELRSRRANGSSTGSRKSYRSGSKNIGPTEPASGSIPGLDAAAGRRRREVREHAGPLVDRLAAPRRSAGVGHRPLQHPLRVLHVRRPGRVQAAVGLADVRGDRAFRSRGGSPRRRQSPTHRRRAALATRNIPLGRNTGCGAGHRRDRH